MDLSLAGSPVKTTGMTDARIRRTVRGIRTVTEAASATHASKAHDVEATATPLASASLDASRARAPLQHFGIETPGSEAVQAGRSTPISGESCDTTPSTTCSFRRRWLLLLLFVFF